MKLGIAYTVFDGIELLEYSILQIRKHVDYIHVSYQTTSWFGKPASDSDINTLNNLKRRGLIDDLQIFNNFRALSDTSMVSINLSKKYEIEKRQFGLDSCILKKCTHFMSMDVDEFYLEKQFSDAKQYIIDHNITKSSCKFINYVKTPQYVRGIDSITVPFICKIDIKSKMAKSFFSKCDPTRGISKRLKDKNIQFSKDIILMHHMETVRIDLSKKYESTTRSIFDRNRTEDLIRGIKSVNDGTEKFSFDKIIFPGTPAVNLKKVDNIFNIPYTKWNL